MDLLAISFCASKKLNRKTEWPYLPHRLFTVFYFSVRSSRSSALRLLLFVVTFEATGITFGILWIQKLIAQFRVPLVSSNGINSPSLVRALYNTVEPRCNEPLFNEVIDIANDFLYPNNTKLYEKEPRYSKQILSVPWRFIKSTVIKAHYCHVLSSNQ